MRSNKKRVSIVAVILVAFLIVVMAFPASGYALTPNVDTNFTPLTVGSNQLKVLDYDHDRDIVAGCFTAPETGKYQIYVVNNGMASQTVALLDEDLCEIEKNYCIYTNQKYTFKTISLAKDEKVYFYSEDYYEPYADVFASKVVIKKVTTSPKLNKSAVSLAKNATTTLKLNNNKNKVTWVSRDKGIATVTSKGVVKGKKAGTTYIYAIANHKLYKCKVAVY